MLWKLLKRGRAAMGGNTGKPVSGNLRPENERHGNPRPEKSRADKMISSERVQIERKQFFFDFKENTSGRFLRITEDVGGHRDTIIVPATGLQVFRDSLDHIIAVDAKTVSPTA
jgi:hypothetical protein